MGEKRVEGTGRKIQQICFNTFFKEIHVTHDKKTTFLSISTIESILQPAFVFLRVAYLPQFEDQFLTQVRVSDQCL